MIAEAEDWMLEEIRGRLGTVFRSVESGPGEWSDAYLKRVISEAPAVRVAWLGGQPQNSSMLTLNTRWAVYVLTGWSGGDQRDRRRGTARSIGAYRACEVIAPLLHNAEVPGVGRIRVAAVENLWTGAVDRVGLALYAIDVVIPVPLDPITDASGLDDFLRGGVDWNLPDSGQAVDASSLVELPQEES